MKMSTASDTLQQQAGQLQAAQKDAMVAAKNRAKFWMIAISLVGALVGIVLAVGTCAAHRSSSTGLYAQPGGGRPGPTPAEFAGGVHPASGLTPQHGPSHGEHDCQPRTMITGVTKNSRGLSTASTQLAATATQLTSGVQDTTEQSAQVAAAAGEMTANMSGMAAPTDQMSRNVGAVASAIDGLRASIGAVTGQTRP